MRSVTCDRKDEAETEDGEQSRVVRKNEAHMFTPLHPHTSVSTSALV